MRKYVKVIASFDCDGNLMPQNIVWDEAHNYTINKVIDIRYSATLDSRDRGIKYTCLISGKEKDLYYEDNRWFVKIRERA